MESNIFFTKGMQNVQFKLDSIEHFHSITDYNARLKLEQINKAKDRILKCFFF
jgi:hypothetical protein